MTCHITVLGDSSSSGIGIGRVCYPAQLARILCERDVHVFNSAVPGFTSADASRFFHDTADSRPLDYVIVYLGNNEGAVGPRKGYYSAVTAWVADNFSSRTRTRFHPVLTPPRFRFSYDVPVQTIAVSPAEFRDNLRSIIRRATRRGARVILLNPIANRRFPCGTGATNSTYFCSLDDLDRMGEPVVNEPIDEASTALDAGLGRFAVREFEEAIALWAPFAAMRNVAGFIARHDIECARALLPGNTSEISLQALVGEYDAYDSTVLYNLAWLKRRQGDPQAGDALLDEAYIKDVSIYRVRPSYRAVIHECASMDRVSVVDLQSILNPADFVDYCHPTEQGHQKIAGAVADIIRSDGRTAPSSGGSRYDVAFPTPNYMHRPGETLVDYYCFDWPIDQDRIAAAVAAVSGAEAGSAGADRDNEIVQCVSNFFGANSHHPIFTDRLNLAGAWRPRSHEILSFPEQFLYRLLYNYSAVFEQAGLAERLSDAAGLEQVRFSADDYQRIIFRTTSDDLDTELDTTRTYFDSVVCKIRRQLTSANVMYRVTLGQRVRTVITWFTREAFRYGTQSRLSMLYARWDIDKIVEALVVTIVIAHIRADETALAQLDGLLSRVLSVLQVHEHHVGLFHRDATSFSLGDYETDLAVAAQSIKAHIASEG